MYRVTVHNKGNEEVIHSPYPDEIKLESGRIVDKINEISSFEFEVAQDIVKSAEYFPLTTYIKVFNTKTLKTEFEGRILDPNNQFSASGYISTHFFCESLLAILHDSMQEYRQYNGLLKNVLLYVLNIHNNKMKDKAPEKQFYLGKFEGLDDITIKLNTTPEHTTFQVIKTEIVDKLGIYFDYENIDGKMYLNFYKSYGYKSEVDIELTINVMSMARKTDISNVYTRLIPLGARVPRDDIKTNDVPQDRVQITSINNGLNYLVDEELETQFSVQEHTEIFDEIKTPEELLSKAKVFFAEYKNKIGYNQYKIDALNLFLIDLKPEPYILGNWHRVWNKLMGIDDIVQIVSATTDIVMPSNSTIEVGDKWFTLEEYQRQSLQYKMRLLQFEEKHFRQNEINKMHIKELEEINRLQQDELERLNKVSELQKQEQERLDKLVNNQGDQISKLNSVYDEVYNQQTGMKIQVNSHRIRIDNAMERIVALERKV